MLRHRRRLIDCLQVARPKSPYASFRRRIAIGCSSAMPFYRFEIRSPLPVAEVADRLRSMIGPPLAFREGFERSFGMDRKEYPPFIGSINDGSFRVRRDIRYRNSFLPRIAGKIIPLATGSSTRVTLYMHPFTIVFMAIWFFMVAVAALDGPRPFASQEGRLIPIGMFVFGLVLCLVGFVPEAIKARRLLRSGVAKSDA